MDLSWCLSCDRHCTEDSLYCSETCRMKDNQSLFSSSTSANSSPASSPESSMFSTFPRPGTPTSPLLEPFFSSFSHSHEHRNSVMIPSIKSSPNSTSYSLFLPIHGT